LLSPFEDLDVAEHLLIVALSMAREPHANARGASIMALPEAAVFTRHQMFDHLKLFYAEIAALR
jgi:hypothetical protein